MNKETKVIPNFLRNADQIVNHLDRLPLYSGYRPKVIIRTAVPSSKPFDPGPQHSDDLTYPFRKMLHTIDVVTLNCTEMIVAEYQKAIRSPKSTLLVEYTEHYRDARAS